MMFWITFVFYEAVWFTTVIGAGRGLTWPALVAVLIFALWRLGVSPHRRVELRLMALSLVLGLLFDGVMVQTDLLIYAAPWPAGFAPAWILALWLAFALIIVPLFGYLQSRPWLATVFGVVGGPLAYLAAGRTSHAVTFVSPIWHALLGLAIGWGVAFPLLTTLAYRWLHALTNPMRSAR